jgi:hypothetical protein
VDNATQELREHVKVPKPLPPLFFVHAFDDNVSVLNSLLLAAEVKRIGGTAEVHAYARGGHGYGLRKVAGQPVTEWPKACEAWIRSIGILE